MVIGHSSSMLLTEKTFLQTHVTFYEHLVVHEFRRPSANSFQYIGLVIWNSLVLSVRHSSSLSSFKSKIRSIRQVTLIPVRLLGRICRRVAVPDHQRVDVTGTSLRQERQAGAVAALRLGRYVSGQSQRFYLQHNAL